MASWLLVLGLMDGMERGRGQRAENMATVLKIRPDPFSLQVLARISPDSDTRPGLDRTLANYDFVSPSRALC
ncbi:hypothetical protein RRG08_008538 [Elysia crispata]|uniref:Uncharacterized protein n=1 Tax=Elysia crispata TaxID=231223 RepID=A0AAE0YDS3_9GAST|nr:hypothetical protein RRG08_008538 [Elysia crispata]